MAKNNQGGGIKLPRSMYNSPYMQNYVAARMEKPKVGKPVKMVTVSRPGKDALSSFPMDIGMGAGADMGYNMGYNADFGMGADAGYVEPAAAKPKRARRFVPVLLIVLFTLLYIAVLGLSYLNLDALADYNGYFAMYEGNPDAEELVVDTEATEETGAENAEAATENTDADTDANTDGTEEGTAAGTDATEGSEDEDVPEPEMVKVGVEDIVMSFVAMFVDSIDGTQYYMYNEFYADISTADTVTMIASYAMPVLLALAALTTVIFFIRALVALFTSKRRKLFVLSAVLMLVFTLLSAVCAFLMVAGMNFSVVMNFLTMDYSLALQLGYGTIILLALSLITLIMTFFAFRSRKKIS